MSQCPCGTGSDFETCCGPLISGKQPATTAEALMRSRYSAFAVNETGYLLQTLHPDHRSDYDPAATQQWADSSEWLKLEILDTADGGKDDQQGTVEFIATFQQKGVTHAHRELSRFSRHKDRWYYTDGKIVTGGTVRNDGAKVGRNDPCPCGSGKKYKKCCG
jgi:SEC-C motif-containing protein